MQVRRLAALFAAASIMLLSSIAAATASGSTSEASASIGESHNIASVQFQAEQDTQGELHGSDEWFAERGLRTTGISTSAETLTTQAIAQTQSPTVEPLLVTATPTGRTFDTTSDSSEEASEESSLPMLAAVPTLPRDGGVVYLTFDDGPDPVYTNQILDLLGTYGAKATFFVVGETAAANPTTLSRIAAEGHSIGLHTYRHEALTEISPADVVSTLAATNAVINQATGLSSQCVRPPYGALDGETYNVLTANGYNAVMWEVDAQDWRGIPAATVANHVIAHLQLGDRVLLHDGPRGRANTVDAVSMILSTLSQVNVTFAPLPNCS